uniref:hypothetical protein n=1 Tax=Okeania hirsuta TaxID=1458930 RepID=UPI000F9037D2
GGLHFISIDGVDYQNLYYFGGVDSLQLDWLEKDLSLVDESKGIITFNHIPFVSPGFSFQNFDSHLFYGPVLLKQKGKLEHRHIVYNYEEVKKRIGDRPFPLALSGHYHAVQEGSIFTYPTTFAQTSAISGPDSFPFQGHIVKSGFTLYEVSVKRYFFRRFKTIHEADCQAFYLICLLIIPLLYELLIKHIETIQIAKVHFINSAITCIINQRHAKLIQAKNT